MSKNKLKSDPSPKNGSFEGDLKYGRRHGNEAPARGEDYPADRVEGIASNLPVAPLTLVAPRDPQVWEKDKGLKIKKSDFSSQNPVNYLIQSFCENKHRLRGNFQLIVGRQKF